MNSKKILRITGISLLWLVTVLEALSMFAAGSGKFTNAEFWGRMFESWGYNGTWFMTFIGGAEAAGAAGLLIPRIAPYAATGLMTIMLGALFTVVTKESGQLGIWPVAMNLILLGVILWFRRPAAWTRA